MAHEIEQDSSTGRAAFVSGNSVDPWHRLGTTLPTGLTADQALDAAFLRGWDVRKVPAQVTVEQLTDEGVTTELVDIPGQFAVVRTHPFTKKAEPLGNPAGVVGTIYKPFQNEQAVDFLAAVTDEFSDAEFETAGSMRNGTQVFVTMKLKNFLIGGVDAHQMYLVYLLNHTTGANLAFTTHIRVVCANTADWALAAATMKFRHSASIDARHQEARDALKMSWNYNAIFEAEAERMLKEKYELDAFKVLCNSIWAPPKAEDDERTKTTHARRWDQLRTLFVFAETQEEIRFTKWGAFNAITEYQDHQARANGKSEAQKVEARALRTIDGGGAFDGKNVKQLAFALLK